MPSPAERTLEVTKDFDDFPKNESSTCLISKIKRVLDIISTGT